jgi:hypothetical protein
MGFARAVELHGLLMTHDQGHGFYNRYMLTRIRHVRSVVASCPCGLLGNRVRTVVQVAMALDESQPESSPRVGLWQRPYACVLQSIHVY